MHDIYTLNGRLVENLSSEALDAERVEEKTVGVEKHLPVVTEDGDEVIVNVGDVPHPMEDDHWIEWIELVADDGVMRKHLKPGDQPEARFPKPRGAYYAREHCNKHGLWARK